MSVLKLPQSAETNILPVKINAVSDKQSCTCWISAVKGMQKYFRKRHMYGTTDLWKALEASSSYCFYCKPKLNIVKNISVRYQILFLEK